MRLRYGLLATAVVALPTFAGDARAQTGYVEPFAGVLIVDDGELDEFGVSVDPGFLIGAVLGYAVRPNWEVAAAYGYSGVTASLEEFGEEEEADAAVHVYFGAVNYVFPSSGPLAFLLTGGLGGITISPDDDVADSSSDLLANFGGGLRWTSSGGGFALQATARDHVQFCQGFDLEDLEDADAFSACPLDDTALHHIEVSGGVLVLF